MLELNGLEVTSIEKVVALLPKMFDILLFVLKNPVIAQNCTPKHNARIPTIPGNAIRVPTSWGGVKL